MLPPQLSSPWQALPSLPPPSPLHTSFWRLFPAPLPGVSSQPLPHPHRHQQKRPLHSSGPTRPECLRSTSLGFRHVLLPTTPGGRSPLAGRRGEASRDRPGSRPSSVAAAARAARRCCDLPAQTRGERREAFRGGGQMRLRDRRTACGWGCLYFLTALLGEYD